MLAIDYFSVHNFSCSLDGVIHLANQQHLIGGFELFGAAFFFGERLHEFVVYLLRLFVNVGKVFVQFAFCEHIGI